MACVLCASSNEVEFPSEIILHFPFSGLENLDKHGVFVYPKVLVCLDCGLSRFNSGNRSGCTCERRRSSDESEEPEKRYRC